MINNYIKRNALLLGAAAVISSGAVAGTWRDITSESLVNPAYIPAWAGGLTATADGVAECYNGAFELHQVINDLPAGEYTLTVNAFYRPRTEGAQKAYIFINDARKAVALRGAEGPNNTWEANEAFAAGNYLNTVTYNHAGGALTIGIMDEGDAADEWTCFDNFKLVGPAGEVAIPNGDFAEGLNADKNQTIWECTNIDNSKKSPDVNKAGGIYRKTNASPYNIAQCIELPAGTYRFSVQSFLRYGGGTTTTGGWWSCKGSQSNWIEGESALDRHNNGTEAEADNAYIFVTSGWDTDEAGNKVKPTTAEYALDPEYGNPAGFYKEVAIMSLFAEKLDVYPDNEPDFNTELTGVDEIDWEGNPYVNLYNSDLYSWWDSGWEYQAARLFVNNPDLYRNVVEFTLDAPTQVWLGLKKDKNAPSQYWMPWRDLKLEVLTDEGGDTPAVTKNVIWKNGVHSTVPAADWNGDARFCLEGNDFNNECTYQFTADVWTALKTAPFYITIKDVASDWHSLRITDGWWSVSYRDGVDENSDLEIDNGDGTYTVKVDLAGTKSPLLDTIDEKHLLFTGANYTLDEIYIAGETGISSVLATPAQDGRIFNLLGVEVGSDYKGVVIKNGKKYIQR